MPLTDRSQAKEGGFAQVRSAMVKFAGDVVSAEFDQWGGALVDDEGKPLPKKEYLEITCVNVEVLELSEDLVMEIDEWNFRVNCSDYKGSFWVEKFLASADEHKILIPDGLVSKRVTFEKVTLEAFDKDGTAKPEFNSTNFIISAVEGGTPVAGKPKVTPKKAVAPVAEAESIEEEGEIEDPMQVALELAVGKTEAQFRSAVALHPAFSNSPLLPLAKAGAITQALLTEGKLELDGTKYKLVG